MVKRLANKHNINKLCDALNISRAGYYAWITRKPGKRAQEDAAIRREILKSHANAPTYGADNIHADVREKLVCGRNRVRRLMRELDVCSIRKRKYRATTNSNHNLAVAPNRLRGFKVAAPNQMWVSDITYIQTCEGWLYMAMVKDYFTKEVVGFTTGDRITSELTENALKQAISRYRPAHGLICHSDRGIQYCCHSYRELLEKNGFISSMSRKGNPYDNAVSENFFSCLKCEMVHLNTFMTRREASLAVFQYVEGFYNRRRRHESLGRISPYEFRVRWMRSHVRVGADHHADTARGVKGSSEASLDAV